MFSFVVLAASLFALTSATFSATSKTNVVTYWGQGNNQARLLTTCQNPSYDIINLAFINQFPGQAAGGWPGDNFGNACYATVYKNAEGVNTTLFSTCPDIGPDIIECQQTYGKKIFLSIGGGYPTDYYIDSAAQAVSFATFLWQAFGPSSAQTSSVPRPFGNAGVDGFDFDIESSISPAPAGHPNYASAYYVNMINEFKNVLFPTDTTKSYYISGAPQCVIPDVHFSTVVSSAWFDFLWIQFYNTASCSARAYIQTLHGTAHGNNISYGNWTTVKSFNPNVKMGIGLPASTTSSSSSTYYLTPTEVYELVKKFYSNAHFGGIMLWEATAAAGNVICSTDYGTWMKDILNAVAAGKTLTTTCTSKRGSDGALPALDGRAASEWFG